MTKIIARSRERFPVYDITYNSQYGRIRNTSAGVQIFYRASLFEDLGGGTYDYSSIHEPTLLAALEATPSWKRIVYDIERGDTTEDNLTLLREAIAITQANYPDRDIGMYRFLPDRDYFAPVNYILKDPSSAAYKASYDTWQAYNQALADSGLYSFLSTTYPSIYQFYDPDVESFVDTDDWQTYFSYNIAEARRFGNPVIPFVNLVYRTTGTDINTGVMAEMLDLVKSEGCEGVAIWRDLSGFESGNGQQPIEDVGDWAGTELIETITPP